MSAPKLTSQYYLSKIMKSKTPEEFFQNTQDFQNFKKHRLVMSMDDYKEAMLGEDVEKMIDAFFLSLY